MHRRLARFVTMAGILAAAAPALAQAQGASSAPLVGPRIELAQAYYLATPATYDSMLVAQQADRKDPLVAGILSWIIPGLGSFYAGNSGHGVRHIVIYAGAVVLLFVGAAQAAEEIDPFTGEVDEGSFALMGAALVVLVANSIWAIITAVGDANAYNRGTGRPGRVVGSLYLDPAVRVLGSNGLRAAGVQQANTGIQLLSVGF
jgi:NADH:ubiquinone oxidoreductase subunit 6 (subunit J)